MMAKYLFENGELGSSNEVVGTLMTNSGLEVYLKNLGINLFRTNVGDRYIMERMKETGSIFGGEPSGHLIFKNQSTTGDGILAALKVLQALKESKKSLSQHLEEVTMYPQVLKAVKVIEKKKLEEMPEVVKCIQDIESKLEGNGRVLFRYSGTEKVARVMIEGPDEVLIEKQCDSICALVKKEIGV